MRNLGNYEGALQGREQDNVAGMSSFELGH